MSVLFLIVWYVVITVLQSMKFSRFSITW